MANWQPLSTASKDGTLIWGGTAWREKDGPVCGYVVKTRYSERFKAWLAVGTLEAWAHVGLTSWHPFVEQPKPEPPTMA